MNPRCPGSTHILHSVWRHCSLGLWTHTTPRLIFPTTISQHVHTFVFFECHGLECILAIILLAMTKCLTGSSIGKGFILSWLTVEGSHGKEGMLEEHEAAGHN